MTAPRFTLVVPAYNEEACLPALLDSVDVARARYHRGHDAVQVVVADNASTDATAEIARRRGCYVVREGKRVIGAARNAGARAARGEILAFIDADSRVHPETFNAVERAIDSGKFVGGATGVRLERMSLGIAATVAAMLPMVWLTGMDTGVVFCRRRDFEAVGGYTEERLFAEDVKFLLDLRRHGRKSGRKLTRVRSAKAIASTRKFDKYGEWHYFTLAGRLVLKGMFSRDSVEQHARRYWYDDR